MRKWIVSLLCALLAVTAGCGVSHTPEPPAAVNFVCDFTASYREMQFAGTLKRASAGMLTVSLTEPVALKGLTLTWDGEGARMSLGLLHYSMDSALPQTGFGKLLLDTLDAVFCGAVSGELTDAGARFSGTVGRLSYTVLSVPETGTLLSLDVPDAALSVCFGNVRTA